MKLRGVVALVLMLGLLGACGDDNGGETAAACGPNTSFGELTSDAPTPTPPFGVEALTLIGDDEKQICVQVAAEGDQPEIGLMGRTSMPDDVGMLFLFEGEHTGGFWMKDTLIPLSIAFADAEGVIVDILDMQPCEADPCDIYQPDSPYSSALEVNIGAFDEWGISEGDTISREA